METQAWGMGELPMHGKRYAVLTERVTLKDGREIVNRTMQEVPETDKPYFWIPSFGTISQDEMEYMADTARERAAHPSDEKLEFQDRARQRRAHLNDMWRDFCEARGAEQKGQRQFALSVK